MKIVIHETFTLQHTQLAQDLFETSQQTNDVLAVKKWVSIKTFQTEIYVLAVERVSILVKILKRVIHVFTVRIYQSGKTSMTSKFRTANFKKKMSDQIKIPRWTNKLRTANFEKQVRIFGQIS